MKRLICMAIMIVAIILTVPVLICKIDVEGTKANVEINDAIYTLKDQWPDYTQAMKKAEEYDFDFYVEDTDGEVIAETKRNLRDTIIYNYSAREAISEIEINNEKKGTIYIVSNHLFNYRQNVILILIVAGVALGLIVIYGGVYIYKSMVRPINSINKIIMDITSGNAIDKEIIAREKLGVYGPCVSLMVDEVKKANDKQLESDKKLREIVASISHDIKNPISSIRAIVEVQQMLTDSEELQVEFGNIISKTEQIRKMISDLHVNVIDDLGHLESNIKQTSSEFLVPLFEEIDYKKKLDCIEISNCLLQIDEFGIRQVLENIIYNSYKYADTAITVKSNFEKDFLVVSIKDYGEGLSKDDLIFLSKKYYRGKNAKDVEGSGIGLYMVSEMMKTMGGKAVFKSEEGKNFEVLIYIKLCGYKE